jgi:NAD(P) transhydrogenase
VIGAGPAGEKAATKAAYLGKKVALIERAERFGGACGKGGLVSKILRESALVYRGAARRLADVLQPIPRQRLEMANLLSAVDRVCDAHYLGVKHSVEKHGIEWLRGTASFVDAHTLSVDGKELTAKVIVIATGSRPSQPDFVPFTAPGVFHADTILGMTTLPRSLTVVGGGVIGTEFASIFAALDVRVHVIEGRDKLLGFLDDDVSEHLLGELRARGTEICLSEAVTECRAEGPGRVHIATNTGRTVESEAVLFCGGRLANTDELHLERIGIDLGRLGRPSVDANYQTTVEGVYAVGDVIGFPALASTSMEQGRVAIGHALRNELSNRKDVLAFDDLHPYPLVPYGLYTIPSVAMVGKTEAELRSAGEPYVVGVSSYEKHARGHLIGDVSGRLKLLAHPETGRVLGVHIVGETAEELVHIGQACMHYQGTIHYFLRSVFNFPTLASLYKSAAYDVLQKLG